ncbi:MAG: DNA repair protein RecN [Cyclobacteriaceae bacterium]
MIKSLLIRNYALIEELEMSPSSTLNIITGETGAGKSIMLGAVGLLLGNRSDTKALLRDDTKCIVEGTFDLTNYKLRVLFEENELDYDDECIIRREINPKGKSRGFVNDTPVSLVFLKSLGERLIDVHSQHESLQLGKKIYQLEVLDAFAAHQKLLDGYAKSYRSYEAAKKRRDDLVRMSNESAEDADYKQYLLNELESADLDDLNQDELEGRLQILENSEDIKLKLSQSQTILDEQEFSTLSQLDEVKQLLAQVSSFADDLAGLYERLESARLELVDIKNEISFSMEKIEYDPESIQKIKEQLDLLYRLQKKHQVLSSDELVEIRDKLAQELLTTANLDGEISKAEKALSDAEKQMISDGGILSESRKLSSLDLSAEIEKIIHKIGIENGKVDINISNSEPSQHGLDAVEIRFSANKGVAPQDISQVASGGEFSRLIFAIKYLIAGKKAMPTVIFDEIDTGVSGEVAIQMVKMMQQMSQNHQVIAISHLPPFAAGGDAHYFVYKDHTSDRSISKIRKLEKDDRIQEIAKMIGGKEPTDSAYSSARELLGIS